MIVKVAGEYETTWELELIAILLTGITLAIRSSVIPLFVYYTNDVLWVEE